MLALDDLEIDDLEPELQLLLRLLNYDKDDSATETLDPMDYDITEEDLEIMIALMNYSKVALRITPLRVAYFAF